MRGAMSAVASKSTMADNVITDYASHWCDQCGKFLERDNPGCWLNTSHRPTVLCLRCARQIVALLTMAVEQAKERR